MLAFNALSLSKGSMPRISPQVSAMVPAMILKYYAGTQYGSPELLVAVEKIAALENSASTAVLIISEPEDVIMAGEAQEIARKFQMANHSIVVSAQHRCQEMCAAVGQAHYASSSLADQNWPVPEAKYAYRYLNPHTLVGKPASLAAMLEQVCTWHWLC